MVSKVESKPDFALANYAAAAFAFRKFQAKAVGCGVGPSANMNRFYLRRLFI